MLSILRIHYWGREKFHYWGREKLKPKLKEYGEALKEFHWYGKDEEAQELLLKLNNEIVFELKKNNCTLYSE